MNLNPEQAAVVASRASALVCMACPGSGKTRTLTEAIAAKIRGGVPARSVLAITFTRLAAAELRRRLDVAVRVNTRGCTIGTFHSICYELVKSRWRELGYASDTIFILDRVESKKLLKEVIFTSRHRATQTAVTDAFAVFVSTGAWPEMSDAVSGIIDAYRRALLDRNSIDYAMITVLAHRVLQEWGYDGYKHVYLDEGQDLDPMMVRFVEMLHPDSIFIVGDPDQLIYGWRGARVGQLQDFAQRWHAEVHTLTVNYRSAAPVIVAANRLISHNTNRPSREMSTEGAPDGKVVRLGTDPDVVAGLMRGYQGSTAVLGRTHDVLEHVAFVLTDRKIPYQIIGRRERLLELEPVKTVLSILCFPEFPSTASVAARVLDSGGCDSVGTEETFYAARREGRPILEFVLRANPSLAGLYAAFADCGLTERLAMCFSWLRSSLEREIPAIYERELLTAVTAYIRQEHSWERRTAARLMAYLNLRDGQDEVRPELDQVQLMTVHAAKGLEFDRVFIVGLRDREFPHKRSSADDDGLEEERRLMFVAMTRARRELFLVVDDDCPSRFVGEIFKEIA